MGTELPHFYTDNRECESTFGDVYELIALASHSVTHEPLYILRSQRGSLNVALPFNEVGKSFKVKR